MELVPLSYYSSSRSNFKEDFKPKIIQLSALQSCQIHGWLNPRRILSWGDICTYRHLSVHKLICEYKIPVQSLRALQPDVFRWIEDKHVSFEDVPLMIEWPLHPITHLKGDLGDLATMQYEPKLLCKLGIDYNYMRSQLRMDDAWMKVLNISAQDWSAHLSFNCEHADEMGPKRVKDVFGIDISLLKVALSAAAAANGSGATAPKPKMYV